MKSLGMIVVSIALHLTFFSHDMDPEFLFTSLGGPDSAPHFFVALGPEWVVSYRSLLEFGSRDRARTVVAPPLAWLLGLIAPAVLFALGTLRGVRELTRISAEARAESRAENLAAASARPAFAWSPGREELSSIAAVIDALERAPRVIVPLVRELPADLLKRRPEAGKWSAHEHACHLAVVHQLFSERLDRMLAEPEPHITPYEPGTDDPEDGLLALDLDESLDRFERDRDRLVERLRRLSPADWSRTAEHGEYSHYSVFIMFRHIALHDFLHAYRIEELLLRREWAHA